MNTIKIIISLFLLAFWSMQPIQATGNENPITSSSTYPTENTPERKMMLQEMNDKEYVRMKLLYKEGKIANRVSLDIVCEKFNTPFSIPPTSSSLSSKEIDEIREVEIQKRVEGCLEEFPENSYFFENTYHGQCLGPQCLLSVSVTEAGLDAAYRGENLIFWEDIPESGLPNKPRTEKAIKRSNFDENPPVDIPSTLAEILVNLPEIKRFSTSGHYKHDEIQMKVHGKFEEIKQKFKADQDQKLQIAVECNENKFYGPLPQDTNELGKEVRSRMSAIMLDVPPKAQGRDFMILKPTETSTCTFIVKVNSVGLENLLYDKRVTGVRLVQGDIPPDTIFVPTYTSPHLNMQVYT